MQLTLATMTQSRRSKSDRVAESQLIQLVVDGGFFFDVDVARWHVRFRLVIIVVADKVLDRVRRKKGLELVIKLRGERLVVRQDKRRPADLLDDLGHGEGLARARHAQQYLMLVAVVNASCQLLDSGFLIAARAIVHHQMKRHNSSVAPS
jgi:hypothetical protein